MFRLLIILPCFFVLLSCASDEKVRRAEYLDAGYLKRLELPPDLIFEGSDLSKTQLKLPVPTDEALATYKECLAEKGCANEKCNCKLK